MFETAETGHRLARTRFERELPALRKALIDAQYDWLTQAPAALVVLVHGMDGAGKGETINTLNAWLDARHIMTWGIGPPSDEEKRRPWFWRFWRRLPPRGKTALFSGSWYSEAFASRGPLPTRLLDRIRCFEAMLAKENVVVLKFWLHLSKQAQRERFRELERRKATRWRVTRRDWKNHARYDRFKARAAEILRGTDTAHAPWIVVEAADPRYRHVTVARRVLEALNGGLTGLADEPAASLLVSPRDTLLLDRLDLGLRLARPDYEKQLERWQNRLARLTREAGFRDLPVVVVFEGPDAAGKGGTIRRITAALDARLYRVIPVAAPSDEERAHPYLWRFWRRVPGRGEVAIFDRSWYGRVLVERVEGFALPEAWLRAYGEINDFEAELTEGGTLIAKYWLAISRAEQHRRLLARQKTGYKKYKLTPEDWRNHARWDDYQQAACDMIEHTSTRHAPWVLVEAEDKYHARVRVLKDLCRRIEKALD